MPTVLIVGPYRFFFYANEGNEPAHIHVARDRALAKFWLHEASLANSSGFNAVELTKLLSIVKDHRTKFMEAWNGFAATKR